MPNKYSANEDFFQNCVKSILKTSSLPNENPSTTIPTALIINILIAFSRTE